MTPAERIDFLVKELAYDNAKAFAAKCGIPIFSLSKWRHGERVPSIASLEKILQAYPEVRRDWLLYEKGKPMLGVPVRGETKELREIKERVENLEKMVVEMRKELEKWRK